MSLAYLWTEIRLGTRPAGQILPVRIGSRLNAPRDEFGRLVLILALRLPRSRPGSTTRPQRAVTQDAQCYPLVIITLDLTVGLESDDSIAEIGQLT